MEQYFNTIFEDVRLERSLILLFNLVEPDILRHSKLTDHQIDMNNKTLCRKNTSTA